MDLDAFLAGVEKRAYRMAYVATSNRDDALELVQEAMMKLVQSYASRDAAQWHPLFMRILQSTIRDWYRREKVRRQWRSFWGRTSEDEDINPMDFVPDETLEPERALKNTRAISELERVLHTLPLRQQQAVMLRIWEGLDVAATAQAMSCSEGSVKTHLSRALHTIKQTLGDHWP